jgi:hypothetical protein
MEPRVSAIFPPNVPVFRCLLPSTGSLGLVPPLHWYCKALRLPATLPALLRFLRFAVPPLRLGLRSRSRKALRLRAWDCCPDSQTGLIDGGDRTSQVPGGPRCERALLSDPGGTSALGRYRASMLSSTNWKVSTPTTNTNFGAQSHGLPTRCLRFVGWLTPPPRKTRFRMAGQPFPGGSEYPLGPTERFQVIPSSFPRLRLAHPNVNIEVRQTGLSKANDPTPVR